MVNPLQKEEPTDGAMMKSSIAHSKILDVEWIARTLPCATILLGSSTFNDIHNILVVKI